MGNVSVLASKMSLFWLPQKYARQRKRVAFWVVGILFCRRFDHLPFAWVFAIV
jgi:hypothetical protein